MYCLDDKVKETIMTTSTQEQQSIPAVNVEAKQKQHEATTVLLSVFIIIYFSFDTRRQFVS